jgi:FKBP-type peptidyl-prolyl cis-trans isomerase SlpA
VTKPRTNDTIVIAFTGTLDNGEVFYTVEKDQPMQLTLGNSELPPTLETAITTMDVGDALKVRVPPDEVYGPRQKDLLQTIDSQEMVDSLKPAPGMVLSLKVNKDGQEETIPATVIEVDGTKVTVDYNHPLAGHHLNYEVVLVDIITATAQ